MSLKTYGYWSGKLKGVELPDNATDVHALIELDTSTGQEATHASINIRSKLFAEKSRLVYWLFQGFQKPDDASFLERGWHEVIQLACLNHREISLDYLRLDEGSHLESAEILRRVDDIGDYLEHLINNAIEKDAVAHIYGQLDRKRKLIHDVHMNQGSCDKF